MKRRRLFAMGVIVLLGLMGLWVATLRRGPSSVTPHNQPSAPAPLRQYPPVSSAHNTNLSTDTHVPTPVPQKTPPNAADWYRKAFALLTELSEEEETLSDWKTDVDPSLAAALCEKLKPITALAHEATALPHCDWGISNIGYATTVSHLSPTRSLGQALVWSAAHCRGGDLTGMADDLAATLRAGEAASQFLIGHLVNTTMEISAMDFLAAHAGKLSMTEQARLAEMFSGSQYEESFYRALEQEAETVIRTADRMAGMTEKELQKMVQIHDEEGQTDPSNKIDTSNRAQILAGIRQVAELQREYVKVLERTDVEYQEWLTKLNATRQTNPFINMLWPSLDAVVEKTRTAVVQRTMMAAGLSLLQRGTGALQQYQDPASGRSFVYRRTADGFELESLYSQNGKPVVMSFRAP